MEAWHSGARKMFQRRLLISYHGSKERERGHKNMNEKEESEDTPLRTTHFS